MGCGNLLSGGEEEDVCIACWNMMDWDNSEEIGVDQDMDPIDLSPSKTHGNVVTSYSGPECTHHGMPHVFDIGNGKVYFCCVLH